MDRDGDFFCVGFVDGGESGWWVGVRGCGLRVCVVGGGGGEIN